MFLINLILFINLIFCRVLKSIMVINNNEIVSKYTFKNPYSKIFYTLKVKII